MFIYRQMHSSVDAMRKILILYSGLGLTILASAGERAALWPEGLPERMSGRAVRRPPRP
jgi:hypothetical protein